MLNIITCIKMNFHFKCLVIKKRKSAGHWQYFIPCKTYKFMCKLREKKVLKNHFEKWWNFKQWSAISEILEVLDLIFAIISSRQNMCHLLPRKCHFSDSWNNYRFWQSLTYTPTKRVCQKNDFSLDTTITIYTLSNFYSF